MSLDELRRAIDGIDEKILDLLNERTRVVFDVGRHKEDNGKAFYVPAREKEVYERLATMNKGPISNEALHAIYREIMSSALSQEKDLSIAYLGPEATFTHQAARAKFGGSVQYRACETITDVFAAVESENVDYGVIPVENSTDGAVTHTLDKFTDTTVNICAEIYLNITHCLLARDDRQSIERLYSKEEVFGQCRHWLHETMAGVELKPVSSTAKAAEMAASEAGTGALASKLAGELYDLQILEEGIQDRGGNTTRFLVIGRHYGPATEKDKTSLLFSVKHTVGALYDALSVFKKHAINMSKIESRPSKQQLWEYCFFVDIEGHAEDELVKTALDELSIHCSMLKILGSYPAVA